MIYQDTFIDRENKMEIINQNSPKYPTTLKNIKNPPSKLYVKGSLETLHKRAIAIIGSRDCTEYGRKIAKQFAYELAKQDICIISGMAKGIDACAHSGAIEAGGVTIAVLGGGFDHIYPIENKCLFRQIIETGGAAFTEYSPETLPNSTYFPERNRIVSGLAMGVLVVEAQYRSGTSITAKIAKKQGKAVFCIPNGITEKHAIGTNRLIQKGSILVASPDDILHYFNISKKRADTLIKQTDKAKNILPSHQKTYQLLSYEPIHINQIIRNTKQEMGETMGILTMLELEGHIKQLPGNYFVRC